MNGVLNAAAPLLFYYAHDLQTRQRHTHASSHDSLVTQFIDKLSAKLGVHDALAACHAYKLQIAGILVTLLRALSGCTRREHALTESGVLSAAALKNLTDVDTKRLKLNVAACAHIGRLLKRLCDSERHSADIKTLVYAAMPAICRANPHIEVNIMQMLMSRIDAYTNLFTLETVVGNQPPVCHLEMSACVELTLVGGGCEIALVLVEPVDVLLQSLEMLARSHWQPKRSSTPHPSTKSSSAHAKAMRLLDAIERVYVQRGGGGNEHVTRLVDKHLEQLDTKCHAASLGDDNEARLGLRLQCLQIAHQLELGIVEGLVEHTLMREAPTAEAYANASLLLARHEAIRSAFSVRLEEMQRRDHEQQKRRKQRSALSTLAPNDQTGNDEETAPTPRRSSKRKLVLTAAAAASSPTRSKRLCAAAASAAKDSQDKENNPATSSTSSEHNARKRRLPLGEIPLSTDNIPPSLPAATATTAAASKAAPESSTSAATQLIGYISSLSFANMNLEHVPRLSLSCLLHMSQLHMCSADSATAVAPGGGSRSSPASVLELIALITSELFVEFTLNMLEKKLASLLDTSSSSSAATARLAYDPESLSSGQLATSLSKLWTCLMQRICGSNTQVPQLTCYRSFFADTSSSSTATNANAYNMKFFQRTYRYTRLGQLIWRHFAAAAAASNDDTETGSERNCDRLVQDERAHYAGDDKRLWSFSHTLGGLHHSPSHMSRLKSEKDKAQLYWKLVANLVRTVKLHLTTTRTPQVLSDATKTKRANERLCAAKICNELLALVTLVLTSRRRPVDILSLVEQQRKHELVEWLYELASHPLVACPIAAASDLATTIYRLIGRVTAQSTTNAHLVKALALDIYHCRSANKTNGWFVGLLFFSLTKV